MLGSLGLLAALLAPRTLANALSTGLSYAPSYVDCPKDMQWIRPTNDGLAEAEAHWIKGKKKVVIEALHGYLERLGLEGLDVCQYIESLKDFDYRHVPTLGLAISGGGYTSGLTGTGILNALDSRITGANEQKIGGLTQALTYLSGQSGGSYPVISFTTSNFPTAYEILDYWKPDLNRDADLNITNNHEGTAASIFDDLAKKLKAGFNISVADYLGRGAGYEFAHGYHGGLNVTMSSVTKQSAFQNYEMPFPIIQLSEVSDSTTEFFGYKVPHSNSTLFEVTPYEFGAPNIGFTPIKYVGTRLFNGAPVNQSLCVENFDSASFLLGSATAAFNFWYIEDESNQTLAQFPKRMTIPSQRREHRLHSKRGSFPLTTIKVLGEAFEEIFGLPFSEIPYAYWPNPFYGFSSSTRRGPDPYKDLEIVDATEVGQAIPLWGLIQPYRKSDFIFAWDCNSDDAPYNWNNGTNLYNTYVQADKEGLAFPIVPPASTFVLNNYTTQPVFFGCHTNLTTSKSIESPIVLYLANAPYSAYTNFSFTQSVFEREQIYEIYENSFNIIAQGNGTLKGKQDWTACLGCAVIDRSVHRVGMKRTEQCETCFGKYCWDGEIAHGDLEILDPSLVLDPSLGFVEWNMTHPF